MCISSHFPTVFSLLSVMFKHLNFPFKKGNFFVKFQVSSWLSVIFRYFYEGCSTSNVSCVLFRENRAISTQNHIESIACSLERGVCQYLAHNYNWPCFCVHCFVAYSLHSMQIWLVRKLKAYLQLGRISKVGRYLA